MKQIAKIIGILTALVTLAALTNPLLHSLNQHTDAMSLLALVSTTSALAVAAGFASERLALALQVYLIRGHSSVSYTKFSDCVNFAAWFCSQWNFVSKGVRQDGFRICGVEVAVTGSIVQFPLPRLREFLLAG